MALLGLAACGGGVPIDPEIGPATVADGTDGADGERDATPGRTRGVPSGEPESDQAGLSAGPETASQPVDPDRVIGQTRARISALLGPPVFVRRDGTAEFWRYRHRSCILELYFYPHNGVPALDHLETRGGAGGKSDRAREARCLGALVASQQKKKG